MNLLIVEDDKATIQSYSDNIDSFNKKSSVQVTYKIVETLKNAKESLISPDYDAAIVDLKLSSNTTELEGLEIVNEIESTLRFPIFVVSGSIGQVDKDENAFFKKRSRDGDFKVVLQEILDIYETGITKILGKKGDVDNYLNTIFWNHLSNSMDLWINDSTRTSEQKQRTLLRYTLLHIQEYLELNEESGFENYHPSEIYITPCIKPNVFTGDLVIENNTSSNYIVLTPSCDLAQGKAKDILIVQIDSSNEGILKEKVGVINKGKASKEVLEEAEYVLKSLIHNSYSNKYHFLPKYKDIEGGLINFQKMKSIRVKEFNQNFTRKASINSTFTKDIVARFSYYYSRQGSPDFDTDELYKGLF